MARVYGTKSVEQALTHLLHVATQTNDPFAYHAIGLQLYAVKSYSEALKYFMKAEQIKSNISPSNLYYIGDCLRRAGQKEEAMRFFRRALTIPVRNRVDYKGHHECKKALILCGLAAEDQPHESTTNATTSSDAK